MFRALDILLVLLSLSLILGVVFGIIFIFKNNNKRPTCYLGFFFFVLSGSAFYTILEQIGWMQSHPEWLFLPIQLDFLFVPLLYLYAKNLTTIVSIKKDFWHLLPGLVEFLFFSVLFLLPSNIKVALYESSGIEIFWLVYVAVNLIYSFTYLFKIYRLVKKHEVEVYDFYSIVEGKLLAWMKPVIYFLGTVGLVWGILNYTYFFFPSETAGPYFALIIFANNVVFILWASIMGLKQVSLMEFVQMKFELQKNAADCKLLGKKAANQFYQYLLDYMKQEEPFTDKELTLSSLASKLKTHPRKLSEILNKEAKMNFNQFVNMHRVEKAKQLLLSTEYGHYSILGIAKEAGFSSKSTFNHAFKKYIGKTPSEYKAEM